MMGCCASRRIYRPILCAAALLAAACPLGSEHPLGSPEEAITDQALLGTWETPEGSEDQFTVTISSSGRRELAIAAENPQQERETFGAFVSELDGERFLNFRDELWYLLNYRIEDGRLRLRIVDDELFESRSFATPEELRAFVRENLHDPRLYGGETGSQWDWELERPRPGG